MEENPVEKKRALVRIRVETDRLSVEEIAASISEFMQSRGFEVIEQSKMYPNMSDRALARVYVLVR